METPAAERRTADEEALDHCRRVLHENWRTGEVGGAHYSYTSPSPHRYPWQWYWDSCLTAVSWRHFDPARSRAELESLLAAATPDGFIGHTIFWGKPIPFPRRLYYNVVTPHDPMTSTIQPPLLAWTWRIAVGDPAQEPRIRAHHELISSQRDLEGDGLLWIIQPDETGLDASPSFDAVWGWRADGLPGFPLLVRRNRRLGFDIQRVREAGGPLVCSTLVNVLHGLSRLALNQPSITPALLDRLYDRDSGLFAQELWPKRETPVVVTWAALSPLALPDLPEDIGRRLVEEHLLNPDRFWLPVPPPSVAADEPSFSVKDRFLGLRRYWRGPTWVNSAWLVWLGLRRLGYRPEADELARRIIATVAREGLREYYHPRTGAGMGAQDFAWSSLVAELIIEDPRAERSYV
ncbi:MAG: MGH1-like glycoside hydrolase domain-containing protein [Solirubrobacteraceae bacterium]